MNRLPLILSSLALLVSLTMGGAYAAQNAGIILGSQIANNSIAVGKLTPNAIRELKGQRGPRGLRGPTGLRGNAGAAGLPGAAGGFDPSKVSYVQGPTTPTFPGQTLSVSATCPAGTIGIGGGYFSGIDDVGGTVAEAGGFGVVMANNTTIEADVYAIAICAAP